MRALAFILAAVFALFGAAVAQTPPGAETYGALPAASAAAISPDGRRLIMAIAAGDATAVRAIEIDSGRELMAARTPAGNTLWGVDWADDDHPLFTISQTVRPQEFFPYGQLRGSPSFIEYGRIGLISIPRRREYYVEPISDARTLPPLFWRILAPIEGDPGYGRVVGWSFANGEDTVYRVSLETGRAGPTIRGVADTLDFVFDERGDVVARVDADTRSNRWRLVRRQVWTEAADTADGTRERAQYREVAGGVSEIGAPPNIAGLLPDGRIGVADDMETRDRAALLAVDLSNGATSVVHEDAAYPIDGAIVDPWTHRVVGAAWTADFPRQVF